LATARSQDAPAVRLRTATSLAKVWRDAGRFDGARTLLAPIYAWFTSGTTRWTLVQARAVLDGMK